MNRIAFCTLGLMWSAACASDRPTGAGPEDWLFSATISGSPDLIDHSGTAYVQATVNVLPNKRCTRRRAMERAEALAALCRAYGNDPYE